MLRNNDVLHLASKYQTILYETGLANAGLMLKESWLASSSEQMLNYFVWDWSNERWTNDEGIMTSPPSEQMLNYFVWNQSNERWTNAEGIMTSPPSEQMLNNFVWD